MPRMHQRMKANYVNPSHPTAFSGITNLQKFYKIPTSKAKEFLAGETTYQLHREYKKTAVRNPFFIYELRQQVQFDLIDISKLAAFNDNIHFLLAGIDCFSRKAWLVPLKNKTAKSTLVGIQKIINPLEVKPKNVLLDRGGEFGGSVIPFFRSLGINVIHPNSDVKAAHVERYNRSQQDLIYKFLTENETSRYIDTLPELLQSYNDRPHRSIARLTPNEAEQYHYQDVVLDAVNKHYSKIVRQGRKQREKFKIGDVVRLQKVGGRFARGYNERSTRELFTIETVNKRMPIIQYTVKSMDNGEVIEGAFYPNELQLCLGDVFKIERVIRKRTRRGKREILVKWQDFGEQHNSWIPETNVTRKY